MSISDSDYEYALSLHRDIVSSCTRTSATLFDKSSDFTTQVDRTIETKLRDALKKEIPEAGFFGEEFDATVASDRPFWLCDPVDGTAVMAFGGRYWSSVLALIDPHEGVGFVSVYQPSTGDQFVWHKNARPYVARDTRTTEILGFKSSQNAFLGEMQGCAYMPSFYHNEMPHVQERLEGLFRKITFPVGSKTRQYAARDIRPGSGSASLIACKIADGIHDFQVLFQQGLYDVAGFVIAQHAGCEVRWSQGSEWPDTNNIQYAFSGLRPDEKINVGVFANHSQYNLLKTLWDNPDINSSDALVL